MQNRIRVLLAILISFGVYFFPVPSLHLTEIWGKVWLQVFKSGFTTPVTMILISLFAIAYQVFFIFCLYKLSFLKNAKAFLLPIPVIAGLYILLIIGLYLTGFASIMIEQMLGINPI